MAVSNTTMPFLAGGQPSHPVVKALASRTPDRAQDDDACGLAAAVGRGDETAFQVLYDRYHARLLRLALVIGRGDESLAQETVQAVFLTAASKLRSVEGEEHLWNWLARVARQHLAKAWRQRQRESAMMVTGDPPESADVTEADSVLEQHLDAALLGLEADDRQLIEWFYFDGLSQKEIGERLNATAKAVSSRLERARARLRATLSRKLSHET